MEEFIKKLKYLEQIELQTPFIEFTKEAFIKQHTHINWCEILIFPNGKVVYAKPSHIKALIKYTGETEEAIYHKMPIDAWPLYWLVNYTRCIAVYTNGYIRPKKCTVAALSTLRTLINEKLTTDKCFIVNDQTK